MSRLSATLLGCGLMLFGGCERVCQTNADCQSGETCSEKSGAKVCSVVSFDFDDGGGTTRRDAGPTADAGTVRDGGPGTCVPGEACRAATGACDVAEVCATDGTCPADALAAQGATCRGAVGACDEPEVCDGASVTCPDDRFLAASMRCRVSAGVCDVEDFCSGNGPACPDTVRSSNEVCRVASGVCDAEERCDGTSGVCPTDSFAGSSVLCRASSGVCDAEERCSGSSSACPADGLAASTVVCRAAAGVCDAEERCSGTSSVCPADGVATSSVVCRAAAGACDAEERCTGSSTVCPGDGFQSSAAVCRAATGVCDAEERCSGSSSTCPSDVLQPASTPCAPLMCSAGSFTFPRTCTGASASCPPPGTQMSCGGFQCSGANTCGTTCSTTSHCIASHWCQFGTCALRAADGQSCLGAGSGVECASGVCTQTFPDADGDGIGAGGGRLAFNCGAAAPAGRSLVAGDCCDSDPRAFPGASAQSTARTGCGGFDFNCDGAETRGDTTGNACQATACNVPCSGGAGWLSGIADCGVTASYVTSCNTLPCSLGSPQLRCAPILESRTQACQ